MSAKLQGPEQAAYVRGTFSKVAGKYDRMNFLMTAGWDKSWRDEVIKIGELKEGMRLLDIGTGTGDLARESFVKQPGLRVTAVDFTLEMMIEGRKRGDLPFVNGDALSLPFDNEQFDIVVSGFLLRNVSDLPQTLREQFRVLKPGGKVVILETTKPTRNILFPFIWVYMHLVIPLVGNLVSGNWEAYKYLSTSTEQFLTAERLAQVLEGIGFTHVRFKRLMAGTVAIHWGKKQSEIKKAAAEKMVTARLF